MKPDTSRWRDQSQYDFYDALPVEGVAWECLHRNAAYQASFDDIVAQDAGGCDFPADPGLSALEQPVVWSPLTNPAVLTLGASLYFLTRSPEGHMVHATLGMAFNI